MEHALQCFVGVKKLDLSENSIQDVSNDIKYMACLEELNLNYNQVATLRPLIKPDVSHALQRLRVLCICNNNLSSLLGVECLVSLEELDVAHNAIESFDELRRLNHLEQLTHFWAEGNPISCEKHARVRIASYFKNWRTFHLDGRLCDQPDEQILIEHYRGIAGADSPVPDKQYPGAASALDFYLGDSDGANSPAVFGGIAPPVPEWAKEDRCNYCGVVFTWALGSAPRHHCRLCGKSVCGKHASHFESLPQFGAEYEEPQRVCDFCFKQLHRPQSPPHSPTNANAIAGGGAGGAAATSTPQAHTLHQPSRVSDRPALFSPDGAGPAITRPMTMRAEELAAGESSPRSPRRRGRQVMIEDQGGASSGGEGTPTSENTASEAIRSATKTKTKTKKKKKKKKAKALGLLEEQDKLHAKVGEIFETGGPNALQIYQAWMEHQGGVNDTSSHADVSRLGDSSIPNTSSISLDADNTSDAHSISSLDPGAIVSASTPMSVGKREPRSPTSTGGGGRPPRAQRQLGMGMGGGEDDSEASFVMPLEGELDENDPDDIDLSLLTPGNSPLRNDRTVTPPGSDMSDSDLPSPLAVPLRRDGLGIPDADMSISSSYDPYGHDDIQPQVVGATEEFLVDLYDRTNQFTSRLIEVQDDKFLLIVNFSTGKTVEMMDLSCLVEIEEIDQDEDERPIIRMSFVYGRNDRRVVKCKMEDMGSGAHLMMLLKPIAEAVNSEGKLNESMSSRTKCLQCNEVFSFEQDRFEGKDRVCPRCNSNMCVDFYGAIASVPGTPLQSPMSSKPVPRERRMSNILPSPAFDEGEAAWGLAGVGGGAGAGAGGGAGRGVGPTIVEGAAKAGGSADAIPGFPAAPVSRKASDIGPNLNDELQIDCRNVDHKTKLLLDLEHFTDSEICMATMTGYVGWRRAAVVVPWQPVPGMVVISNQALYIFTTSPADDSLTMLGRYKWAELGQITLGIGMQCMLFITDGVLYNLWTGNADMTWSFLQVLAQDIKPLAACRLEWLDSIRLLSISNIIEEVAEYIADGPNYVGAGTIGELRTTYAGQRNTVKQYEKEMDFQSVLVAQSRMVEGPDGELMLCILTSMTFYLLKRDFQAKDNAWTIVHQSDVTNVRALGYSLAAPHELTVLLWDADGDDVDVDVARDPTSDADHSQQNVLQLMFRSRSSIAELYLNLNLLWEESFGMKLPWYRLPGERPEDTCAKQEAAAEAAAYADYANAPF
jgi:hypothetical protein